MKENSHILQQAIKEFPPVLPPGDLWDRIEESMFFDAFTHLPKQAAPVGIWHRVNNSMRHHQTISRWVALLIPLMLLLGIGGEYYLSNHSSDVYTVPSMDRQEQLPFDQLNKHMEATAMESIKRPPKSIHLSSTAVRKKEIIPASPNILFANLLHPPEELPDNRGQSKLLVINSRKVGAVLQINKPSPDIKLKPYETDCSPFTSPENFSIGVSAAYMQLSGNPSFESTRFRHWYSLDVDMRYQRNRFIIGLGLGYGNSRDCSEVTYTYLQNTLIDTYEYVDSVYYDPINGNTTYYTTTVEVYDSIEHQNKSESTQCYQTIQIPLTLAYEVIQGRKLSLSILGGVTYINQKLYKEIRPDLYEQQARITAINNPVAVRNAQNFKLTLGVQAKVHLNHRWDWMIIPSGSYFTKELYKNSPKSNLFGLGIQTGIRYNF